MIVVDVAKQALHFEGKSYAISTAKNGVGQRINSQCTPIGRHIIAQKIGAGLPVDSVLVARVPTGEIYSQVLADAHPNRDWILTRILWLAGTQAGLNQGVDKEGVCCDSHARYIYIHGTPDSEPMGVPCSHGCIRMTNHDVVELFDRVSVGTLVCIV